jgi:transcriptional regulator with XRE-family HTH domain
MPAIELRRLRLAHGYSLDQLAARSGIDPGSLSRQERGQQSPRLRSLVAIANGLGVPVGQLADAMAAPEPDRAEAAS